MNKTFMTTLALSILLLGCANVEEAKNFSATATPFAQVIISNSQTIGQIWPQCQFAPEYQSTRDLKPTFIYKFYLDSVVITWQNPVPASSFPVGENKCDERIISLWTETAQTFDGQKAIPIKWACAAIRELMWIGAAPVATSGRNSNPSWWKLLRFTVYNQEPDLDSGKKRIVVGNAGTLGAAILLGGGLGPSTNTKSVEVFVSDLSSLLPKCPRR